jgi:hypothetical protein
MKKNQKYKVLISNIHKKITLNFHTNLKIQIQN